MKKCLLASLLALAFVGNAIAAPVPLTGGLQVVTVGGAASGLGTIVVGAGGTQSVGYELNTAGHATGTIWALSLGGQPGVNVNVELFADADGDNIFDDALDTALFSFNISNIALSQTAFLGGGEAIFARFTNNGTDTAFVSTTVSAVSSVPVPAAAWLFGSALFGAGALRRKQKTA